MKLNKIDQETYKFCILNPNIKIKYQQSSLCGHKDDISNYCIVELRGDDILINVIGKHNDKIVNNTTIIEPPEINVNDFNVFEYSIKIMFAELKRSGFLKEIDLIENTECTKMMLCDYSEESIEEYLKSLL